MAEFSRIQVTPAEEEDIVIVAGAVEEPASAGAGDTSVMEEAASDDAPTPEQPASQRSTTTQHRPRAAYEETTLEDLQRTRMSGMQKAIIGLAIAAVVAFIIWYVLLR